MTKVQIDPTYNPTSTNCNATTGTTDVMSIETVLEPPPELKVFILWRHLRARYGHHMFIMNEFYFETAAMHHHESFPRLCRRPLRKLNASAIP